MARRFTRHEPKATPGGQPRGNSASTAAKASEPPAAARPGSGQSKAKAKEIGGPSGLEPTRYGDWERKGICVDF